MCVIAINQVLWITFAPITGTAASFYRVSDLSIGLLSMSFMIIYILVSIPASWIIDKYGIKVAVGIGIILTGVFGLLRGIVVNNYSLVLIMQIGIAIGQPFILNAITSVAAHWFPIKERATAAGLGSLAMYLGIAMGMVITPYLTVKYQMAGMLMTYGIISIFIIVLFFILVKNRPPTPPCHPDQEERALVFDGLKNAFRNKNFILLMIIFFIGLGIFNAVTTWIEDILRPRGFTIIEAGNIGGMMILGGIVGAVVIPILSDRSQKRIPYLITAVIGATLGLIGITYANTFLLLIVSAFLFGFFLLSAGPVGFQYGAEVTHPTPEGTSNGLLLLMGQISGIMFIFCMDIFKSAETGSMTLPLTVLVIFMVVSFFFSTKLKEPTVYKKL